MQIELTLNGTPTTFEVDKSDLLLDVLRRNGYTGAKRGCDTGACGMCMIQVDGEAIQSCVTPATRADGADVETIEGLGTQDDLHPIQQAFVDHTALQCGFCIPGFIMRSKALLEDNPDPSEREVREALEENLCRCTGYTKIVEAVLDAADRVDGDGDVAGDGEVAADGGALVDGATRLDETTSVDDETPLDDACCGPADGSAGGCCRGDSP